VAGRALGVVWRHYLHASVGEQGSSESTLVCHRIIEWSGLEGTLKIIWFQPCAPEASLFLIKTTVLQTLQGGRKLPRVENSPFSICSLGMGDKDCLHFKEYFKIFYNYSLTMHSDSGFFTCLNMVFLCWAGLAFSSLSSPLDIFLLTNLILTSCLTIPYKYVLLGWF